LETAKGKKKVETSKNLATNLQGKRRETLSQEAGVKNSKEPWGGYYGEPWGLSLTLTQKEKKKAKRWGKGPKEGGWRLHQRDPESRGA